MYDRACENSGLKAYSYRQYCTLFSKWCEQNDVAFTTPAYSGQSMKVDFAGNTFEIHKIVSLIVSIRLTI